MDQKNKNNIRFFPFGKVDQEALFKHCSQVEFDDVLVIGIAKGGGLYIAGMNDRLVDINGLLDLAKDDLVAQMRLHVENP